MQQIARTEIAGRRLKDYARERIRRDHCVGTITRRGPNHSVLAKSLTPAKRTESSNPLRSSNESLRTADTVRVFLRRAPLVMGVDWNVLGAWSASFDDLIMLRLSSFVVIRESNR